MGSEADSLFRDFAQITHGKNLETPAVGQQGSRPRHEAVEPSHLADEVIARPQVQMIGVGQNDPDIQAFELVLRDRFHGRGGPDGHEHRGLDVAVRGGQPAQPRRAFGLEDLKIEFVSHS